MVAWASAALGDLAEVDRATASALGLFQSGQVHWWGLHSAAWRAYALTLLGQWDEALAVAEHARKIWAEGGLIPAAYCVHGFIAALDVGRARHDGQLVDQYRAVLDEILKHFAADSLFGRLRPYGRGDLETLEAEVVRGFATIPRARQQLVERTLSLCADLDRSLSPRRSGRSWNVPPPTACGCWRPRRDGRSASRCATRRARARPRDLRESGCGALCRARPLRAGAPHQRSERARGRMRVLESLGDLDQLARVARARGKASARRDSVPPCPALAANWTNGLAGALRQLAFSPTPASAVTKPLR